MDNSKTAFFILFTFHLFFSCSTSDNDNRIIFNFDTNLDGWETGTTGKQYDSVLWVDWAGQPPGAVKLDGSDFGTPDHEPNSWIYKEISIPVKSNTLSFLTSAHDRENANAELRIRLIDENQNSNILSDWELAENGVENELIWIEKKIDISGFSGQQVTLYFEQGDNDIGIHEQRYIDKIQIY
jgi:hypothetical protein